MSANQTTERAIAPFPGIPMLLLHLALLLGIIGGMAMEGNRLLNPEVPRQEASGTSTRSTSTPAELVDRTIQSLRPPEQRQNQFLGECVVAMIVCSVVIFSAMAGLVTVAPNEALVLLLYGRYYGTLRSQGFWYVNPFTSSKERVSLRVRNFETATLKVNDENGSPIEIGGIIVWRVSDPTKATLDVEDYEKFVKIQGEAALRIMANKFPYEGSAEKPSQNLRSGSDEVVGFFRTQMAERLANIGIETVDCRISHLAYAPEIAQSMLRRQQAGAIIAARKAIVEGAMGLVDDVLAHFSKTDPSKPDSALNMDNERKAILATNLMITLVAEQGVQPIINAGTANP